MILKPTQREQWGEPRPRRRRVTSVTLCRNQCRQNGTPASCVRSTTLLFCFNLYQDWILESVIRSRILSGFCRRRAHWRNQLPIRSQCHPTIRRETVNHIAISLRNWSQMNLASTWQRVRNCRKHTLKLLQFNESIFLLDMVWCAATLRAEPFFVLAIPCHSVKR